MAKRDQDADGVDDTGLGEGHEPTEDVGPEEAGVGPGDCEFLPGALDGTPERCQATFADEIAEAFPLEAIPMIPHPLDGLPVPADERFEEAIAPPFTMDTVICVEDDREYAELFEEEAVARKITLGLHDTCFIVARNQYQIDGTERTPCAFAKERVILRWGHPFVVVMSGEIDGLPAGEAKQVLVPVRPRRERCKHYKRQAFNNDAQPNPNDFGHIIIFRNCDARRSVGGAFLSVRDQAIYACEHRSPPDPGSVQNKLDHYDRKTLTEQPHLVHLPFLERS